MPRKFLIAGALSILVIGGLTVLQHVMGLRMQDYISAGKDLSLWDRILFGVSSLWRTFWWFLTPLILFVTFGVALMVDVVFRKDG